MAYPGVSLIVFQSESFSLCHAPGESGRFLAKILYGCVWALGFWCIDANQSDPLSCAQ